MAIPSITISPPEHKISIETVSGFVFMQENIAYGFVPSASNTALVSPIDINNVPISTSIAPAIIGGMSLQPDINVQVGSSGNSIVQNLLNSFRYTFPYFPYEEVVGGVSPGQVIYFSSTEVINTPDTFGVYNSSVQLADTSSVSKGAVSNLFMYISHAETADIIMLHKGYYEMPDDLIVNWTPGKTIYLNAEGKLDTSPSATSGHWVRSLGFCIPNNQHKKTVWFEPDSTYLKIL
tara:strand:- start:2415 stop:3119 length:705 start_codon:yes stop_codon:yes gene_type:complete